MTAEQRQPEELDGGWPGLYPAINAIVGSDKDAGTWAGLSDAAARVWFVLAKYADAGSGRCWPSVGTICKKSGKSRTAVYSALHELESAGLITRESSAGGTKNDTTIYTLLPVPSTAPVPPAGRVKARSPVPSAAPIPVPPTGRTRTAHGTRSFHESPNGLSEKSARSNSSNRDAAGDAAAGVLREALIRSGFAPVDVDAVAREASTVGWSAAEIEALYRSKPARCGAGWMRKRLRDGAVLASLRTNIAKLEQQRAEAEAWKREQADRQVREARERYEANAAAIDKYVAGLDDKAIEQQARRMWPTETLSVEFIRGVDGWGYRLYIHEYQPRDLKAIHPDRRQCDRGR